MMPFLRQPLMVLTLLLLITACAAKTPTEPEIAVFHHDIAGAAVPWTDNAFDNSKDKFTFAIFSDLTGGEREGVFALAVEQLRLLRPELIIGVGDLIDGVGEDHAQLTEEWESFDQRAMRARAPLFHVGGNHDLSGEDLWEIWEERYAKRYYHFVYKNALFLVLDTEDNTPEFQRHMFKKRNEAIAIFNADGRQAFSESEYGQLQERKSGRIGSEQAAYFQNVIAQYPKVRWTFVFMHKPAWERLDEENFSTIESALSDQPYTVFYGHLHSYLYEQRLGRDYIRLGTTGGSHVADDTMAFDHVSMVTVADEGVDIANLRMSGIFDKTGKLPLNGEDMCLKACVSK
jgi:hypothetical protein